MTVAVWNGGTTDDVAQRIHTGDVAIDLYRPVEPARLVPRGRPRPGHVPPAHPRRRADGGRGHARSTCASRPALDLGCVRGARSLLGVVVSFGDPHAGGRERLLAARPERGPRSPRCSRCSSPAWWSRWCCSPAGPRRGDGAALGGVRAGADRHLAGPAGGRGRPRRAAFQAGWAAVLLLAVRRAAARWPTARWWSRVVERCRRLAWDLRAFTILACDVDPGVAGPTARRSLILTVGAFLITGVDFVGDRGDVRQRRRPRRVRRWPRSPSCTARRRSASGLADLAARQRRAARARDPDRHVRRDDGPPDRGVRPDVRRRVRAPPARPDRPGGARLRLVAHRSSTSTGLPPGR